jgi:outer membrane protein OmpA-like peptidoglycan-associated protein
MKKISTVQFSLNTYYLNAAAKATLQKVAAIIMQSPNKVVLIYGNTDIQTGVDNVWLSHQRAISAFTYIRTFLRGKTIKLGWFAATKPAVAGKTQAAYAKNRRVEIWVN